MIQKNPSNQFFNAPFYDISDEPQQSLIFIWSTTKYEKEK